MIRLSYLFFQTDANFFRESIRNLFFGLKKKKKKKKGLNLFGWVCNNLFISFLNLFISLIELENFHENIKKKKKKKKV